MDLTQSASNTLKETKVYAFLAQKKVADIQDLFLSLCQVNIGSVVDCITNNFDRNLINAEILKNYIKKVPEKLEDRVFGNVEEVDKSVELSNDVVGIIDNAYVLSKNFGMGVLDSEFILLSALNNKKFEEIAKKFKGNVAKAKKYIEDSEKTISDFELKDEDKLSEAEQNEPKDPLSAFGVCLNDSVQFTPPNPVIGREKELKSFVEVLNRKEKNNPLFIGEAGCGKTSIVEGLALKINAGDVPEFLLGIEIWKIDIASIVAGCKFRGQFEEKIYQLIKLVKERKIRTILFIDEIHMIVGAGDVNGGSLDAGNILKPSLSRGELQIIGATTFAEYKKTIEKDTALARRFQVIKLSEPSEEQTFDILKGIKSSYEQHHLVKYTDDSLHLIIRYAGKYMTERFFPDKAIDILDLAGSKTNTKTFKKPDYLNQVYEKYFSILIERLSCEENFNSEVLKKKETRAFGKYDREYRKWYTLQCEKMPDVSTDDIIESISDLSGIPQSEFKLTEKDKLSHLEEHLNQNIFGQNEAAKLVSNAIIKSKAGLGNQDKPYCSFLFCGDSGVGKTFFAKNLAKYMFGTESNLITLDMSEFSEKISVTKLTGSAPGYVGYEEGSQLIEAVRKKPNSIILVDEIEKAHPDVINVFLQILDEGRLKDASGRLASFKNSIIIFTSNVGCNIPSKKEAGFFQETSQEKISEDIFAELKKTFKVEFLNRIDKTIIFNKLNKEIFAQILNKNIQDLSNKLLPKKISINISQEVKDKILSKLDEKNGAREIERVFGENVSDKISKAIVFEEIKEGDILDFVLENDEIKFSKKCKN
jgi:ATP-dependent Clp protease ATP-binding subunit ClpC